MIHHEGHDLYHNDVTNIVDIVAKAKYTGKAHTFDSFKILHTGDNEHVQIVAQTPIKIIIITFHMSSVPILQACVTCHLYSITYHLTNTLCSFICSSKAAMDISGGLVMRLEEVW